jgi:hypothetical protein
MDLVYVSIAAEAAAVTAVGVVPLLSGCVAVAVMRDATAAERSGV